MANGNEQNVQNNDASKPEAKETKTPKVAKVSSQDFFEEKAKEAGEKGEDVIIDLTHKVKVEFLKDTKYIKKGHIQEISQQAFETYNQHEDVVKKVK
ncbi:hypothetical protein CHRYSEOSP005_14880 [Chryseobacterium sp. Alg-005]|uniref:hypothetical protein n=1 Tax=Chryseobacterium sp. Alg-005 TaxID=3159516 RepID=UPI003555AC2B